MLSLTLEAIESYAYAHTTNESPVLQDIFKETFSKTKRPNWSVGHLVGVFLKFLVKAIKAKRVLEIGTFTGYSALAIAEGLPDDGEIITLDINKETTDIAQIYWAKSTHGKKIRLILGPAIDTLKTLEGKFDLIFLDADKINYPNYWESCVSLVKSGGCIVADNVIWHGRVLNPKDEESLAIDTFNKMVLSDSRVETVMLTVRDGLLLIYKK